MPVMPTCPAEFAGKCPHPSRKRGEVRFGK
jgi:hypothetical protein